MSRDFVPHREAKIGLPDRKPKAPKAPNNTTVRTRMDGSKEALSRLPEHQPDTSGLEEGEELVVEQRSPNSYHATVGSKPETEMGKLAKEAASGIEDVTPFKDGAEWRAALSDPRYTGRDSRGNMTLKDDDFIREVERRTAASMAAGTI